MVPGVEGRVHADLGLTSGWPLVNSRREGIEDRPLGAVVWDDVGMADDWLVELRQLRQDPGPTIRMSAKVFPVRRSEALMPAALWLLRRVRRRPRQVLALDVALYEADAGPGALPVALASMPANSWLGDIRGEVPVEVAGRPAPGRAVALTRGSDIAFCAGPCRRPTVFRSRYRL